MSQQLMDDFACFADPKLKPGQGTITIGYFRATCPRPARGGSQSGPARLRRVSALLCVLKWPCPMPGALPSPDGAPCREHQSWRSVNHR